MSKICWMIGKHCRPWSESDLGDYTVCSGLADHRVTIIKALFFKQKVLTFFLFLHKSTYCLLIRSTVPGPLWVPSYIVFFQGEIKLILIYISVFWRYCYAVKFQKKTKKKKVKKYILYYTFILLLLFDLFLLFILLKFYHSKISSK